jgi:hypothetical protein
MRRRASAMMTMMMTIEQTIESRLTRHRYARTPRDMRGVLFVRCDQWQTRRVVTTRRP